MVGLPAIDTGLGLRCFHRHAAHRVLRPIFGPPQRPIACVGKFLPALFAVPAAAAARIMK